MVLLPSTCEKFNSIKLVFNYESWTYVQNLFPGQVQTPPYPPNMARLPPPGPPPGSMGGMPPKPGLYTNQS